MSAPTILCAPAWACKPLTLQVQGKLRDAPNLLRLVPVFFNPLALLDLDALTLEKASGLAAGKSATESATEKEGGKCRAVSFEAKADKHVGKWEDAFEHYFHRKKRVVSEYMNDHKISSLLRTFEVMSRHEKRCGSPITLTWQNGNRGCFGIINNKGDVAFNHQGSNGMEKVVVDSVKNVVMLRSTKWDHCITGHIDRATVDGKADSSDVTACHWRVISCQIAFQDSSCDPSHVLLQFYGKNHSKDSIQDGMFFVVMGEKEFRLEAFQYVKDHGIFILQ